MTCIHVTGTVVSGMRICYNEQIQAILIESKVHVTSTITSQIHHHLFLLPTALLTCVSQPDKTSGSSKRNCFSPFAQTQVHHQDT